MPTLHVSSVWLAMTALTAAIVIVLPFIFGNLVRKQLGVGWKYFWFGVLVFLVFQLLTRVPLVIALQATVLAPLLRTFITFTWIWLVILALTASLFEEVGRYVGYRVCMRRELKTWAKGVLFGLGHEGLESAVLTGGQLILTLIGLVLWRYTYEIAHYFGRLSTPELSTELDRRQQWLTRALLIWGMICAVGLIFGHALFVLPPVTSAQLNAYSTALNMLLVGISLLWNYRLIQGGKQQLRQRTGDRPDQAQEGADG